MIRRVAPARGGVIVLGSGAVARLNLADARRLVEVAASGRAEALTNNRYSSDIVALGRASALKRVPALPSDNALPRWLEEIAGVSVGELPGRDRLALDLDTPLDVCLAALAPGASAWLRRAVDDAGLALPWLDDLRAVARDPTKELLIFGRSGSRTLAWLERNVRCRVRFLAEERGLRASVRWPSPARHAGPDRQPTSTLSLLLARAAPKRLPMSSPSWPTPRSSTRGCCSPPAWVATSQPGRRRPIVSRAISTITPPSRTRGSRADAIGR